MEILYEGAVEGDDLFLWTAGRSGDSPGDPDGCALPLWKAQLPLLQGEKDSKALWRRPLPDDSRQRAEGGSEENSETYFIGTPRIILRLRLQKRRGNPGQRCGSCGAGESFEAGH